jgi:hypothetical protein
MLIFYKEVSLDEGFEIIAKEKPQRLVNGRAVSAPSGKLLFEAIRAAGESLHCWSCGLVGNCFVLNKGSNDQVSKPVLDLYSSDGVTYTLMTRDHIIPKSYGGSNEVANLRVGCGPCNHGRGNELDAADIMFMRTHPELIVSKPKLKLADDEHMFVAKSPSGPKIKQKINSPEEAAANKRAKAKAKRLRQKANRKAKLEQPYITMLALALA